MNLVVSARNQEEEHSCQCLSMNSGIVASIQSEKKDMVLGVGWQS